MVTMNLLNNSVTTNIRQEEHRTLMHQHVSTRRNRRITGVLTMLVAGLTSLLLGILSTQFSLRGATLNERARMSPSLPPYSMWTHPNVIVRLSMHIFTVLNADAFLDGRDEKMRLHEIGPIVYREHLRHDDVVRHAENSTLSYTAVRWLEFLDDENEPGILNRTITVPNFALLSAASMFHDASFFTKVAFKALKLSTGDTAFINITVYDYLWNYHSKLVKGAKRLVPFMVPVENAGIFEIIYKNLVDRYNVRIGNTYPGPQFFQINTINGQATVPGHDQTPGSCVASVVNSTEGAVYGQHVQRGVDQLYWRKTLCRVVPLTYVGDVQEGLLTAYHFKLMNNTYDRSANASTDCYKSSGSRTLPDGLSDVSKCFYDMPLAASNPHFYGRESHFTHKFEGLSPDAERHVSYAIVEPSLGMPIRQCAKSQSNLVIPNLNGLTRDLERFSDMVLPLFWLQYHLRELSTEINVALVTVVKVLPIVQLVGTLLLFFSSMVFFLIATLRFKDSPRQLLDRRLSTTAQRRLSMVIVKANETLARHLVMDSSGADEKSSMCKNRV